VIPVVVPDPPQVEYRPVEEPAPFEYESNPDANAYPTGFWTRTSKCDPATREENWFYTGGQDGNTREEIRRYDGGYKDTVDWTVDLALQTGRI